MKIAIVTSIFGNQPLHTPTVYHKDCSYFAFVDEYRECEVWDQLKSSPFSNNSYPNRRNAKPYKILTPLFLPNFDYLIWADPTHDVVMDPIAICDKLGENSIGVFKHTHRDCVYDEINECSKLGIDDEHLLRHQEIFYRNNNYPNNNGLYELPAFVWKNTQEAITIGLSWWELICSMASRDQISLPYILWKLKVLPYIFDGFANNGLHQNAYIPQVRWKGE